MLDPWIIEEILKREEAKRREQERPFAELPIDRFPFPIDTPSVTPPREEGGERGVVIIDL